MDAAVECLIERGVAGTTTLAVQRKAEVSRGALLHHFPSHATLLAASVAELVKRNERAVLHSRAELRASSDKLETAIRSLAFAARQPAYLAELELWAVARTDNVLKQALIAAERAAKRDLERVYTSLFGDWVNSETYDDVVSLTLHLVRGLAVSENIRVSIQRRERLIVAWTSAVRMLLRQGAPNKDSKRAGQY
ncbi:TetR/AcrR family transcriptional regulator [Bradyrhizobium sp. sGM-13]|uniref:TetR/AcrR family transcriptional regulator n=1 Tax=Bradyrhizobium sp. sGM-13 TaxID=2831781 RepID=UPI0020BE578F|nr:TetR/AcrR family transcriptional regulator [Bradyrhizobium sp. sGM-13]